MSRVPYAGDGPASGGSGLAQGIRQYIRATSAGTGAGATDIPASFPLPGGTYTFYLSGQGGNVGPNFAGGPGALCVATRLIQPTDMITTVSGSTPTVTLPDGTVMSAGAGGMGGGSGGGVGAPGTATGGDYNVSGTSGSSVPPSYNGVLATGYGTSNAGYYGPASLLIIKVS